MSRENEARLLRLAEAIGDETPVNWRAESASNPELAALIERLQGIEAVASGFRGLQTLEGHSTGTGTGTGTGNIEPLFDWGHLEVREKLGEGSFGEVFRASDPLLQRDVALKLRRPGPSRDEDSGRRFIAEARRLARIRHNNVVAVHGADLHDGRVGLWTELVHGTTLEERLAEHGLLGAHEAVSVGIDLCRALAAVHGAGLVHGDIKAANVLREHGGRIVLTDFGSGTEHGAAAAPFGSPASIAPEVLQGAPPRPESDLYSLGVLLFKLVSGQLPVPGENPSELVEAHRQGKHSSLRDLRPDIGADFIGVIERVLDPDPGARFASAGEMERALTDVIRSDPDSQTGPRRVNPSSRAIPFMIASIILISVVAVILAVGALSPRPAEQPGSDGVPVAASAAQDGPIASELAEQITTVAGPAPRSLAIQTDLYRGGEQPETLGSGAIVAPGDQLYLEVETGEEIHLYILNADRVGNLFVLFPLPGTDVNNPLPPGRHRLPGRLNGIPQDWQVTSAGGTETFLVVASRVHQTEFEHDLRAFRAAAERPGPEDQENLRGIGGLTESASPSGDVGLVDEIHQSMRSRQERDPDVWVRRIDLLNPVR